MVGNMRFRIKPFFPAGVSDSARTSIWIALVVGSSVLFSLAFACATPFPALATIAGVRMLRRDALTLIGVTWLMNQSIGYLVLGYPQTWDSFAWGGAIGLSAMLATVAVAQYAFRFGATLRATILGFLVAFAVYEAVLFAATTVLPSSAEAFSLAVVAWIFWINGLALVGLSAMYQLAVMARLLTIPGSKEASAVGHA